MPSSDNHLIFPLCSLLNSAGVQEWEALEFKEMSVRDEGTAARGGEQGGKKTRFNFQRDKATKAKRGREKKRDKKNPKRIKEDGRSGDGPESLAVCICVDTTLANTLRVEAVYYSH